MKASELIRLLKNNGFRFDRQAKGSHEIWVNDKTSKTTVVPNHGSKEVPTGTLNKILKQAGLK